MNLEHLNHNGIHSSANSNTSTTTLVQAQQQQQQQQQQHSNLDELFILLRNEIPEGRQVLLDTQSNLEKVADYCTTAYNESKEKRLHFEKTQNYTTHSLASVAYQINTLAYNILHMLDLQTNQIAEMESQMNYVTQKMAFHKEKVARREIALLTSAKSVPRQPKVLMPVNEEKQGRYHRKPIDYSILDDIGHGVRVETNNQIYRAPSTASRMSGTQTLGHKSSMSSSSHYHHFNTLTGGGPAPTTKPPTPPQAIRSHGTLGRNTNKEYRTLAPPIAPPQVPKNYESNYPLGHPKNPLTQRQSSATYSTLPNNGHGQYSIYGGAMSSVSLNSNNPANQYGQSMMALGTNGHANHSMVHTNNVLPPPPPMSHGMSSNSIGSENLPEPPPHMSAHHGHQNASFDSTRSTGSPPLPPPPPILEETTVTHTGVHQHPANAIYGSSYRQQNLPDWVPPNYIEKVIAIYDYKADKDDELTFQENSIIYVIRKNDDGWYEGVMNGVTGLFPGNYVDHCV